MNSIQRQVQSFNSQSGLNVNSIQRQFQSLGHQIGFNVNTILRQIQPLNPQIGFNVNSLQRQIQLSKPQIGFNVNSNQRQIHELSLLSLLGNDLGCTAVAMVYGTTLRLPGMFFMLPSNHTDTTDPSNYVQLFQSVMRRLQPTPPRLLHDLHCHANSQLIFTIPCLYTTRFF